MPEVITNLQPPAPPTRERIFAAAVALFARDGFPGVSIRTITRAVGIRESSFYNHFASKEALLEAIFTYYREQVARALPPVEQLPRLLDGADPKAFLARGNELFLTYLAAPLTRQIWQILFLEQGHNEAARVLIEQELLERPLAFTEAVFELFAARGLLRPLAPRLLAAQYQYGVAAIFTRYLILGGDVVDSMRGERELAEYLDTFWELARADGPQ